MVLFFPSSFLVLVQSQRRLSENIYLLCKQGIFPPSIFLFTLCVSLHLSLSCPFPFSLLPFPSFKLIQHGVQIHLDSNSFSSRRRQWHPTPVRLPGKSHGRRSLVAAVHGVAKSQARLRDFTFTHWRRKWQPTPVFLPGESQG